MATPEQLKDWKAPWEAKGEDIDAEKAKKFAHSLLLREEKALKDATAAATAKVKSDQTASTLKARVDELSGNADENTKALQAKVADLETKLTAATEATSAATNRQKLVFQVALERGLTYSQARKLEGDTLDALNADADDTFGKFESDKEGDGDDVLPVVRPTVNLRTPLDPNGTKPFDPIAAAALVPRS